jgi:purine-cytosine permease-like protein
MTKKHTVRLGKYRVPLPASRILRILIGVVLILGGFLGFLPLLGFWMVPLGLLVLSIDIAIARHWRRRFEIWWGKRKAAKAGGRRKEK